MRSFKLHFSVKLFFAAMFIFSTHTFACFDTYLDDILGQAVVVNEYPDSVRKNLDNWYFTHSVTPTGRVRIDSDYDYEAARTAFEEIEETLIIEWEDLYDMKWPTYSVDNEWRAAGDKYDAHHIIPMSHHGPNQAWNIMPLEFPKHWGFHNPTHVGYGLNCCLLFPRSCGDRL